MIGCGGAGKTTLSRELGELLDLPVIHIDGHYWREVAGERIESSAEEWASCHADLVGGQRWVIDGMKLGVLPDRLRRADTVIYLDLSTLACLSGIARRRFRFRGQVRPELGIYDRITWQFLRWVLSFRRRQRPAILKLLATYGGTILVVRRRGEVSQVLAALATRSGAVSDSGRPSRQAAVVTRRSEVGGIRGAAPGQGRPGARSADDLADGRRPLRA